MHLLKGISRRTVSALLVACTTLIVFLPALRNGFVNRDDDLYVYKNPLIANIDAAFLKAAFLDFRAANWHPLTWVSHAVDYAVWGLEPLGHHLTNIVIHAANAALVVLLVYAIFDTLKARDTRSLGEAPPPTEGSLLVMAVATALLFALHPLRVESVAWVSERKDVLCGLFYLLSLIAYLRYLGGTYHLHGRKRFLAVPYLLSLVSFCCAVLSKPMAITLPVTFLILDWYPFGRTGSWRAAAAVVAEKIPFFLVVLGSAVLTYLAQNSGGTVVGIDYVPLTSRLLVSAAAIITYLREMVWPLGLTPFNSYPDDVTTSSPYFLSVSFLVVALTVACLASARRNRIWLATWGFYCITLLPVVGIVKVGLQATADRYTYLPSLGPTLLVGVALAQGYQWCAKQKQYRVALMGSALVLLGGICAITVRQIGVWHDSAALWTCAIENRSSTEGAQAHQGVYTGLLYRNRAVAYIEAGEYGKAIDDLNRAIVLYPDNSDFYGNRGLAQLRLGAYDQALADLNVSLDLDQRDPAIFAGRGSVYHAKGKNDLALGDLNQAIALSPRDYKLYGERAEVQYALNRKVEAVQDLSTAIALNPDDAEAYYNRAHLRLQAGGTDLAAGDLRKACELGLEKGCQEASAYSGADGSTVKE